MGFTAGNIIAFGYTAAGKKGLPADVVQNLMDEVVAIETAFVNGRVRCSAYHNTTQILATGIGAALELNTAEFDVGTMWTSAPGNTRITVPANNAGVYLAIGGTSFPAHATGYRQLKLKKNSATNLANVIIPVSSASVQTDIMISAFVSLAVSDYLELIGVQNSGAVMNVGSATREESTFLQVVRIW